jgi:thiamine phosphate synthase YjbQ (UPF0047 family)
MDDVRQFLRKLAPPEYPYLHNDLHLREEPDVRSCTAVHSCTQLNPIHLNHRACCPKVESSLPVAYAEGTWALGTQPLNLNVHVRSWFLQKFRVQATRAALYALGWPGGWEAWAAQEPENCHSHLLSMLLGNSETVPVVGGCAS